MLSTYVTENNLLCACAIPSLHLWPCGWKIPVLDWYPPFLYHLGIYNEYFTFYNTNRVWEFDNIFVSIPFGYIYQVRTSIPSQNHPSMI